MNIKRGLKNNFGFTIAEMITTVAIVGIMTSIGIPSYLQARRNTNMEMVRQHMRQISEKMIEVLGKKGKFSCAANSSDPTCSDEAKWPLIGSFDPDEQAITASLSAIDNLCYTTNEYSTNDSRTSYVFCSSPKLDSCGANAGNKKFCVHYDPQVSALFAPGMVGEFNTWEALPNPPMSSAWMAFLYDPVNINSSINTSFKTLELLARSLEVISMYNLYGTTPNSTGPLNSFVQSGYAFSQYLRFSKQDEARVDGYLKQANEYFLSKGIQLIAREESLQVYNADVIKNLGADYAGGNSLLAYQGEVYTVSFKFERPTDVPPGGVNEWLNKTPWAQEALNCFSQNFLEYC
ncbi:MAG: hypothetical protein A3G33_03070 [Omnitrophica bacterium RIFCSPLOWO2_12_FULL_44_17]|uniref:Type II secretion system protein GspG C-terminal domain-containing protein n=1 Tax=Candidatus Danuiimicrobium aquiferis TaxID=1801832 RepID=A0A1G1KR14_9BACT|nr:MAG: hypothetical protein A3B72_01825 [Omnitrophica bacterium RIFCSPHIGHO2_02_FULL_45_28]OGW95318.1 MAG: hypothetical protein A3G33_03070 [Omnitrophica bacterium RIFCSPLOWO2_12_FULL_44_17]OGX04721.1 MAG: hypothetical protein A3J12_09100 [Omnitrophica bacterium RIFCSPLOWO2_02_FULL_44_11]